MLLLLLAKPAANRETEPAPKPVVAPPASARAAAPVSPGASPAKPSATPLEIRLDNGRALTVDLRVPDGEHGRLPVVMVFGGLRRSGRALDVEAGGRPVILASVNYPYVPPRTFSFPVSLTHAPALRRAIHGSFEAVEKLYAALRLRPDVDPARITVLGAGDGAPFALVGAARAGIPGVVLVHGFADVPAVVQHLFDRRPRSTLGGWLSKPARWLALWISRYCEIPDIAAQARALAPKQKVLLLTAEDDEYIPRPASEALWTALQESGASVERIVQPGQHLDAGQKEDSRKRLQPAMAWLEGQGLI